MTKHTQKSEIGASPERTRVPIHGTYHLLENLVHRPLVYAPIAANVMTSIAGIEPLSNLGTEDGNTREEVPVGDALFLVDQKQENAILLAKYGDVHGERR